MFSRPTFKRIIRNKSTEQFSGLPYIYAFLNCLICLWYGSPAVKTGIILVATVNSFGAVFQLIYISIFIAYAEKEIKVTIPPSLLPFLIDIPLRTLLIVWSLQCWLQVRMLGLLLVVLAIFGLIVYVSLRVLDYDGRQIFVGYLSVFSLISMFASPLFIIVSLCKQISFNLFSDTAISDFLYFHIHHTRGFTYIHYFRNWW